MTRRRDFLAMTTGGVAARTVLPIAARAEKPTAEPAIPDDPDVDLLRLGVAFEQAWTVQRQADAIAMGRGLDDDHPDWVKADALDDATGEIVDRIEKATATTLPGLLVKMRAIIWCRPDNPIDADIFSYCGGDGSRGLCTDERLIVSLLTDLQSLAMGAGA